MGDQIGDSVSTELSFVPKAEFVKLLDSKVDKISKTKIFAAFCRINVLYMISNAGSGHIGSSFSSLDIMSWIQVNEIYKDLSERENKELIFFSSKGHDAPALYATLMGTGRLDFDLIHSLRKIDGLPGHPDIKTPEIVTNTGSLGMGISKAKGLATADRLNKKNSRYVVMVGDGELQEGQLWESLISAANHRQSELLVIVDHNKLQSDTLVSKTSDLGSLEEKFSAFGWKVFRCNGNDMQDFSLTFSKTKEIKDQPQVIIADTVKGKGVTFMEHTSIDSDVHMYKFHSGAPDEISYREALTELVNNVNELLSFAGMSPVGLSTNRQTPVVTKIKNQSLISSYSRILVELAQKNEKIVALDADLILDTGLIPFKEEFPERFIECGIAEQDMVSQAGGLALAGYLPIVHSFSCFLSSRPNEQIYNNSTEQTKIIYVGSLAGVIPGGPGHSHQAVRDIAALSGISNLLIFEPANGRELEEILSWAIDEKVKSSIYIRLTSVPWENDFELGKEYKVEPGRGVVLRRGEDATIIAYGPIMLSNALGVAQKLEDQLGLKVRVINLPWLNYIDIKWLQAELVANKPLFTIDNHNVESGQGVRVNASLVNLGKLNISVENFGVKGVPACGKNDEVLKSCNLDIDSLFESVKSKLIQ